jgi:hypothetical protein
MGVTSISDFRLARDAGREAELKRLAIQLAVQLPKDPQEALDTVRHLETLVRSFLADPRPV